MICKELIKARGIPRGNFLTGKKEFIEKQNVNINLT